MRRVILAIIVVAVFAGVAAVFSYAWLKRAPDRNAAGAVDFRIERGETAETIAANLAAAGLIRSKWAFLTQAWLDREEAGFQAGEYRIAKSMSAGEISALLTSGETINQEVTIRLIEGWNSREMADYLEKQGIITDGSFLASARTKIVDWPFPGPRPAVFGRAPAAADLEGYLFPDTYRIFRGATAAEIINKMLLNFAAQVSDELFAEINRQGKSLHDIVIIASILEKEVSGAEDRRLVAGILYRRLELGMRLEVDSTINYLTGKNNPQSEYADLSIDSPYNTYKYGGLPPGPISNPSLSALEAAVYPVASEYLFYLNRLDTGATIYSRTFDEHVTNKRKYLP